jgi:hypothetical protein
MSTIDPNDKFLVQRGENSYRTNASELMSTIDTTKDWMLIQRGENSFKVSAQDVKDQLGSGEGGDPVIISTALVQDQTNSNRFTGNSFTTEVNGAQVAQLKMEASVTGALSIEGTTDVVEENNSTGSSSIPLKLKTDFNLNNGTFEVGDVVQTSGTYQPVTSEITNVTQALNMVASNWGSPGRVLNGDQSTKGSSVNFSASDTDEWGTIDFGEEIDVTSFNAFTRILSVPNQFRLVDEAGNVVHFVQDFPTQGANPTVIYSGLPIKARYYQQRVFNGGIWTSDDFHTFNLNGPQVICSNVDVAAGTGTYELDNTILEFADNTDLKYFQAGDVVKAAEYAVGAEVVPGGVDFTSPPDANYQERFSNIFGPENATFYKSGKTDITVTFTPPLEYVGGQMQMYHAKINGIEIFYEEGGTTYFDPNESNTGISTINIQPDQTIRQIRFFTSPGSVNNSVSWIKLSGQVVTLSLDQFKVVSTNVAANKMIVDGGDWSTGNTVTVPAKRGEGTISSISGTNVVIAPFVDNAFITDQYLVHKEPKVVTVTPKSDSIDDYDRATKVLALSGDKDLLDFATGDEVSMCDADGNPAQATVETSGVTTTEAKDIWAPVAQDIDADGAYNNGNGNLGKILDTDATSGVQLDSNGGDSFNGVRFNIPITSTDGSGLEIGIYTVSHGNYFAGTVKVNNVDYTTPGLPPIPNEYGPGEMVVPIPVGNISLTSVKGRAFSGGATGLTYIRNAGNKQLLVDQARFTPTPENGGQQLIVNFEDNTNLQYFKAGDVLKSQVPTGNPDWNETKMWSNFISSQSGSWGSGTPSNVFDGNTGTDVLEETAITFNPPDLTFTDKIEIYTSTNNNNDGSKVYRVITTNGTYETTAGSANSAHGNYYVGWVTMTQDMSSGSKGPILEIYTGQSDVWNSWYAVRVDGKILVDPSGSISVVKSEPENNRLFVTALTVTAGETFSKSISGTGTIDIVDPMTSTITLSASNDEWAADYYVTTPAKPAVSMTAYLNFDGDGAVTGLQSFPYSSLMLNVYSPTLTFPNTFSTGDAPDVSIPSPSYLQTAVTGIGDVDTEKVSSNILFPATTTVLGLKTPKTYTTEEFGEFCRWACSYEYRDAVKTVQDTEETVADLREKAEKLALNFINAQAEKKSPSGEGA